jgi:hypothetical protein
MRVFQKEPPKYKVTKLDEYKCVEIDWQGYNTECMSEQLSKSILFYNQFFEHVSNKLNSIENKVTSTYNNKEFKKNGEFKEIEQFDSGLSHPLLHSDFGLPDYR